MGISFQALEKAEDAYRAAANAAQAAYRKWFAQTITRASRIEVFLLSPFTVKAEQVATDGARVIRLPPGLFPVILFGESAEILKRNELSADEIKLLLPSLIATVSVQENRAALLCHYPAHGIRVWDGDRIAFQTTINYDCRAFSMEYPDGPSNFVSLSSPEFAEAMNLLTPLDAKQELEKKNDGQQSPAGGGDKPSN